MSIPISILFVSEAASSNGKHFYQFNTPLYQAVKAAFEVKFGSFKSDQQFISIFNSLACYLDHLCLQPVARSEPQQRREGRENCITSLASRLKLYEPAMIVIMMKGILPDVKKAITVSGITCVKTTRIVSFPAMSERNRLNCIAGVVDALTEAVELQII